MTEKEIFYLETGRESELFAETWRARLPLLLKGPTGCGKTRFVEHMAAKLGRPLVTVACNEDTSATDLLGRHLGMFNGVSGDASDQLAEARKILGGVDSAID